MGLARRSSGALLGLLLVPSTAPAVDAGLVVRLAAENQRAAEEQGASLTFRQVEVRTELLDDGRRGPAERFTYLSSSDGRGVTRRHLVEVDGRPPTGREVERARRQDDKRREKAARQGTGGGTEDLLSGHLPLSDLLTRFDFRFVREEPFAGRPAYLVEFRPRKGLEARTVKDRVLNGFAGRAWIDAAELQPIRIEGRLTRPVEVAGGLALSLRNVRFLYEGQPVLPGVWAPCLEEIRVDGRAAVVLGFSREIRYEFSDYRGTPSLAQTRPRAL